MDSCRNLPRCSHMRDWILQENDRVSTEMVVKLRYGNNLIFLLKVVLSGREGLWTGNWRPKHVSITSEQFTRFVQTLLGYFCSGA